VLALYIQEIPRPVLIAIVAAGAAFWCALYGAIVVWWWRRLRSKGRGERKDMILTTVAVLAVLALFGSVVP
jgi:hypothetical protein